MSYFKNFPIAKIGLLAIPLLILVVLMGVTFPKVETNYSSFIIAFEFVTLDEEVIELLNHVPQEELENVNYGNYIDFFYMLVYSSFLFLLWRKAFSTQGNQTLRFGYLLIALILIGDFAENLQLIEILNAFQAGSSQFTKQLNLLSIFTWLKWECLAIIFVGFGTYFLSGNVMHKVLAGLLIIPFILSLQAFGGSPLMISWFTTSIVGAFVILIIYCFVKKDVSHT